MSRQHQHLHMIHKQQLQCYYYCYYYYYYLPSTLVTLRTKHGSWWVTTINWDCGGWWQAPSIAVTGWENIWCAPKKAKGHHSEWVVLSCSIASCYYYLLNLTFLMPASSHESQSSSQQQWAKPQTKKNHHPHIHEKNARSSGVNCEPLLNLLLGTRSAHISAMLRLLEGCAASCCTILVLVLLLLRMWRKISSFLVIKKLN